jgi:hypothetical protein
MAGCENPPRPDQRTAATGAAAGAEVAAKIDDRVPGKLRRANFLHPRVDRSDDCRVGVVI